MSTKLKLSPSQDKELHRELFKSGILSMLYSLFTSRKRQAAILGQKYLLQDMADAIGVDKSQASRWFNGDASPNWRLSTFYDICDALGGGLRVEIVDRATGEIHTPAGIAGTYYRSGSASMVTTLASAITGSGTVTASGTTISHHSSSKGIGSSISVGIGTTYPLMFVDTYAQAFVATA